MNLFKELKIKEKAIKATQWRVSKRTKRQYGESILLKKVIQHDVNDDTTLDITINLLYIRIELIKWFSDNNYGQVLTEDYFTIFTHFPLYIKFNKIFKKLWKDHKNSEYLKYHKKIIKKQNFSVKLLQYNYTFIKIIFK